MTARLVSVVVPTYQRAHLIADALGSVLAQSYRPVEVIVVDDGSDDGTDKAVADWAAQHSGAIDVRYVRQANAGGNAARNRGIAEARGGIVAFLDSDDTWHPSKLERQVSLLGPETGAVYCGVVETDLDETPLFPAVARPYPQGRILDRLLVRDVTAPTSAFIVRSEVFERAGTFDTGLAARQDWDMWIRIAAETGIAAVPEPLVNLRHHDGPRTASDPTREMRAYAEIRRKYRPLLRAQPLRVRAAALSAYHRRLGRVNARYRGRPLAALGHYVLATAVWPVEPDNYSAAVGLFLPDTVRRKVRVGWNRLLGRTIFAIRSH